MKVKFSYISLKDEDEEIKTFALLPCLVYAKDYSISKESFALILVWFGGGISMTFSKPIEIKTYVECKQPIPYLLTRDKEYEVLKTIYNSYVVKRDDGSVDRISKTRFNSPIKR
jgi:hypothetical protein